MKHPRSSIALLLLLLPTLLWAKAGDREQPIHIEADSKTTYYREGYGVYSGNVVIRQGSLNIEADKVTVHTLADHGLEKIIAEGGPARFRQTADNGDLITGQGLRLEYHAQSNELFILRQGVLQRDGDRLQSERIVYHTETEVVEAGEGGDSRVEITLQPAEDGQ